MLKARTEKKMQCSGMKEDGDTSSAGELLMLMLLLLRELCFHPSSA